LPTILLLATWILAIAGSPANAIEAVDDLGNRLSLTAPATRIITLAPHATDLVVAAGAADKLIAVAPFSVLPEGRLPLPYIGGPGALDREALLGLQPDLVVAWHSGNRLADLEWLKRSNIAVYASEPGDLAQIAESIRAIGRIAGTTAMANAGADSFTQDLQTPCRHLPKVAAFVLIWERPAMTVGGRHWLNSVLAATGFSNVMQQVDRGVFAINAEAAQAVGTTFLINLADGSHARRLSGQLSRPGPHLGEAVRELCRLRLTIVNDRSTDAPADSRRQAYSSR
jgi:iron complex transport system substrate-binding protein